MKEKKYRKIEVNRSAFNSGIDAGRNLNLTIGLKERENKEYIQTKLSL